MRDPHVQKLYYEIGTGEGISYKDPEPVTFSNQLGVFDLRNGKLAVVPTEHFANEDSACYRTVSASLGDRDRSQF